MADKLAHLRQIFSEMGSVLVAYSGGLDSAFVLKVATDVLGDRAVGLTAVSPSLPERERVDAERIAKALGAHHIVVDTNELADPNYAANPQNRCFFCKSELYRTTTREQTARGLAAVVNGTNTDDLGDYRPGLEAARKAGVRSPLVEAGLSKAEVRELARTLGMDVWDKPASACLSSRIPYGTPVTRERLAQIGALEDALKDLGLRQVRVRHHGELARIEVARAELERAFAARDAIVGAGKRVGYTFVTLDLAGYRTGSLNELLRVLG
jgi:uncharacterized protein